MITETRSAECDTTNSSMEDSIEKEGGGNFVKQGFELILLDEFHLVGAVRKFKTDGGHGWAEHRLLSTRVI